jgi:beta propeller repeat protein
VIWKDERNDAGDIYGYNLATHQEFPVVVEPGEQLDPIVTGNLVIWTDASAWDIWAMDLTTMTKFPVCTDGQYKRGGSTNGTVFVWHEAVSGGYQIRGWDRSTNTFLTISTSDNYETWPSITGDTVVWTDRRGVYGYNLTTKQEFPICTQPGVAGGIGGNVVFWQTSGGDIYGAYVLTGA